MIPNTDLPTLYRDGKRAPTSGAGRGADTVGGARRHRVAVPERRWWRPCRRREGPGGTRPLWRRPRGTHRFGHGDDHDHGERAGVLEAIRDEAAGVHERLDHDHGVFTVELLGSTGGGKTALGEALIERLDGRVGVVCGDVAGDDDAERYRDHGVPVANVSTGKECHLDPGRVDDALDVFDLSALDVLLVENVGNMVCPADFPLGASVRLLAVSPTEGDDVVRKHPLLFQAADAVALNKVDIADAVGADVDRMAADVEDIAPDLPVVRTSAETGTGVERLVALLADSRGSHDDAEV